MDLNQILKSGIKNISNTAKRFYLKNHKGRKFMLKLAKEFRKDNEIRERHETDGTHIPPFLIASIAEECNLHCHGCYARATGGCGEQAEAKQMPIDDWRRIFNEASELGISFILLAGGEPLLRKDIIEAAARTDDILFPIFTNGTMLNEDYIKLFSDHRNLIPVISIEGDAKQTDTRRGEGVSDIIDKAAKKLQKSGILYGMSVMVTTENYNEVTAPDYVSALRENGCGIIFYVEYVPIEPNTEHLVLNDRELQILASRVDLLKADKKNKSTIILSFPGDEHKLGGCLAAGRGFFHINVSGNAEPCPFSPFSAVNLRSESLLNALRSPFFEKVREITAHEGKSGGCTLHNHQDKVQTALK